MAVNLVSDSICGERVGGPSRPSRTFVARRICAAEECTTVLSIYNEDAHCAIHGSHCGPFRHDIRPRRGRGCGQGPGEERSKR
jgi:hypothetical protein